MAGLDFYKGTTPFIRQNLLLFVFIHLSCNVPIESFTDICTFAISNFYYFGLGVSFFWSMVFSMARHRRPSVEETLPVQSEITHSTTTEDSSEYEPAEKAYRPEDIRIDLQDTEIWKTFTNGVLNEMVCDFIFSALVY